MEKNRVLKRFKKLCKDCFEFIRFPYLRIRKMPGFRPSLHSIYYLLNQLGKHQPEGLTHAIGVGYHELPFPELRFKVSRSDLHERILLLTKRYSVFNKYGVDVGCALGGITFALQKQGAHMLGIDRDQPSLEVAQECEDYFHTGATFWCGNVNCHTWGELVKKHHSPDSGQLDFVVWLSSFNWVAKALGLEQTITLIREISDTTDVLFIDSALGGKGQEHMTSMGIRTNAEFADFILRHSTFKRIISLGAYDSWYDRELFLFSHKEAI